MDRKYYTYKTKHGTTRIGKVSKITAIIFIAIGLLFFALGVYAGAMGDDVNDGRVYTTATITKIVELRDRDGDSTHYTYISFEADGEIIEAELNTYLFTYYEGKAIEIYYYPANPQIVKTKNGYLLFAILFPIMGLILVASGVFNLVKARIDKKDKVDNTGVDRKDEDGNAIGYDSTMEYPFE